jgi:hypothetical protein
MRSVMAQAVVDSINNFAERYYYAFGRPDSWPNESNPPVPTDNFAANMEARRAMIYAKAIQPQEISLVVSRINWTENTIYDQYDDRYSTELIGVNLLSGGSGYTSVPTVTVAGTGTGATAVAEIDITLGKVTKITVTNGGTGYLNSAVNPLTVTISGGEGTGATATGVLALAQGNVARLEDSKFYVYTDEFNLYICLNNNGGVPSTIKPYGTSSVPFQTSDGYIWKFIYTVPAALRERFLTPTWIPVNTSLKQGFTSGGAINSLQILNPGSGYTAITKINISGDGFRASNPYWLTGATVTTAGVGYTSATLTFSDPVGSVTWAASRAYEVGQFIKNAGNIYQIVVGGTSTATAPTTTSLTTDQVAGPTYRFVGRQATATVAIASGGLGAITWTNQGVRGVNITNGGTGYANGPNTVTFSSGAAAGVAFAQNGVIYRIDITNPGLYNGIVPTITSVAGGGTGFAGTCEMAYGWGYSSAPSITVSGAGTITTPAVVASVVTKSEALVYPIITGGVITGHQVVDAGVGYTSATATVVGNGTGAAISADIFIGDVTTLQSSIELTAIDGAIHNIQTVSGGYGFTTAPTIIIEGDGTGAVATASVVNGAISKFTVTNMGSGYRWANIRIIGDGLGASARAIISPFGGHGRNVVRGLFARTIMITSYLSKDLVQSTALGADYRQFSIIRNPLKFSGGTPLLASIASACYNLTPATTVPAAFAVDSLATSFPLTGAVAQNIAVVINPSVLSLSSTAGLKTGMGVFGTGIQPNTTITVGLDNTITLSAPGSGLTVGQQLKFNYYSNHRVVYQSSGRIYLMGLSNVSPAAGDTFYSSDGLSNFTVATVTPPDIDKYSGDFLYLNNRTAFQPLDGSSQKITVNTVLKF